MKRLMITKIYEIITKSRAMGQQTSKEESIHQRVLEKNVDAIRALCTHPARLEWVKEGKTPLMVACMDPKLYKVAKTLIGLGANIDAYCPGRQGGTPMHLAAMRGVYHAVRLLLSHRANPFMKNDDSQTPLDVARANGFCNVVRMIEAHISHFSGVLRKITVMPGSLQSLVRQRVSRQRSIESWVVVVPCSLPNPSAPPELELAIYNSSQDSQPRTVVPLSNCLITETQFYGSDPVLEILDQSTGTLYQLLPAIEGDWLPLAHLYNACKGLPKVMPSSQPSHTGTSPWLNLAYAETAAIPIALNSSILSAGSIHPGFVSSTNSESNLSEDTVTLSESSLRRSGCWAPPPPPPDTVILTWTPTQPQHLGAEGAASSSGVADGSRGAGSNCVICWDVPFEGVCIPCGHMACCMSCLTKVQSRNGQCPVCRAKIHQVIRVYTV